MSWKGVIWYGGGAGVAVLYSVVVGAVREFWTKTKLFDVKWADSSDIATTDYIIEYEVEIGVNGAGGGLYTPQGDYDLSHGELSGAYCQIDVSITENNEPGLFEVYVQTSSVRNASFPALGSATAERYFESRVNYTPNQLPYEKKRITIRTNKGFIANISMDANGNWSFIPGPNGNVAKYVPYNNGAFGTVLANLGHGMEFIGATVSSLGPFVNTIFNPPSDPVRNTETYELKVNPPFTEQIYNSQDDFPSTPQGEVLYTDRSTLKSFVTTNLSSFVIWSKPLISTKTNLAAVAGSPVLYEALYSPRFYTVKQQLSEDYVLVMQSPITFGPQAKVYRLRTSNVPLRVSILDDGTVLNPRDTSAGSTSRFFNLGDYNDNGYISLEIKDGNFIRYLVDSDIVGGLSVAERLSTSAQSFRVSSPGGSVSESIAAIEAVNGIVTSIARIVDD